jgi:hypothetical protein
MHTNLARVEQENLTEIPILMPGDISPEVMHDYTDACEGYFEQKRLQRTNKSGKF